MRTIVKLWSARLRDVLVVNRFRVPADAEASFRVDLERAHATFAECAGYRDLTNPSNRST